MPPSPVPSARPVALVTGASSGIGRAAALALHDAGFLVHASARREDALHDLRARGLKTLALDVTDEASRVAAVRRVERESGPVAVLVNNAGYGLNGPAEELDLDDVRRLLETNVLGLLRLSQLVLPGMRAAGRGRIVHVGSIGGTFAAPGAGAYHASKYAVEALSDAMRVEVAPFGVRVVLIQPTGVRTPFLDKLDGGRDTGPDSPYAFFKAGLANTVRTMNAPNSRYGLVTPGDVARAIVRAASAPRPPARIRVGASAHLYGGLRRLLPDALWDRVMAARFPVLPARGAGTRRPA